MFEVLKKIETLLRQQFKSRIKTFVIGDPSLVAESSLPCIAIVPVSSSTNIADVSRDLVTYTVEIILMMNAKNEIAGKTNQTVGTEFLAETMEKVDSSGKLDENTISSVVRKNLRIEKNLEIENVSTIEYGVELRGEQLFTREARLRLNIMRINTRS